tara:strand:+ start:3737 stop:4273 length:537 start_codon:yes stop_codon:yes gene_type:complete
MDNLTGKTLLLSSISKYFKNNPKHLEQFKNIILGKSFISLRLIDWLLTHFAKNNNIQYWIDDDNKKIFKTLPDNIKKAASLRKFNMYIDYRAQLKSFSKMYFDPFRRHERINYKISDKEIIETTIGQLNLFRWFFKNYIYEYIVNNYTEISKNMSSKNKNDKKIIEPIQQEFRYIKFN